MVSRRKSAHEDGKFLFMCAFLRFKEGMPLKNQAFARQNELKHRRKLRVVLRQLTQNRLTAEQRCVIEQAAGHQRQCHLKLCSTPQVIRRTIDMNSTHSRTTAAKTLFGSLDNPPMALLVHQIGANGTDNTICIYLPDEKEEE